MFSTILSVCLVIRMVELVNSALNLKANAVE